MAKKWSVVLAALAIGTYSMVQAEETQDNTVVISISSKIRVDKELEKDFLNEAKEDGKMLTKKWATVRGVAEVETTVNRDECDGSCKKESVRCEECGKNRTDETLTASSEETKCACGKPKQKCHSCGKPKDCSSCSSCCK